MPLAFSFQVRDKIIFHDDSEVHAVICADSRPTFMYRELKRESGAVWIAAEDKLAIEVTSVTVPKAVASNGIQSELLTGMVEVDSICGNRMSGVEDRLAK